MEGTLKLQFAFSEEARAGLDLSTEEAAAIGEYKPLLLLTEKGVPERGSGLDLDVSCDVRRNKRSSFFGTTWGVSIDTEPEFGSIYA